ncbi:tetratricopeptide repeat protein, partial [Porphyromonas circumdentaria]
MAYGQQIPLKGIVTVQNSRVNTGKTEYVSEASISHPNAKPTATDSRGAFTLQILRLKSGAQTAIEVKPTGRYKDYIVVDEQLIKDITLGRTTPISICIQDRRILEEREKRLIAVTVKKQNEIRERKIAELNKRIAALEEANDYANEQYQKSIDSLTLLANDKGQAIKRIREYAKDMVLINLDEADSIYRRAYQFFEEGELDSVASYLRRHINFEEESKQIQQQLREARDKKSLARELDGQADQQLANAEGAQAQLLKKLLLAAKASAELYNYNEAIQYYEQALALAPEDISTMWKYAVYLQEIKEPQKSLHYLLTIKKRLEKDPKTSPGAWGEILRTLGGVSDDLRDYKAGQDYLAQALVIYEKLVSENPKVYLPDLVMSLNNLGANYNAQKYYVNASVCVSRAIAIYEQLATESPKVYLPNLAAGLNNQGINYSDQKDYAKASARYSRAIAIREQLASENPKVYLPDLASSLNNLGANYSYQKDYTKAAECYSRAIAIREQLASENPKVYLPDLA